MESLPWWPTFRWIPKGCTSTCATLWPARVTVYQDRAEAPGLVFAVPSGDMIVAASNTADVHAMLDRMNNPSGSLGQDADMEDLITLAASGSDAWFVMRDVEARTPDQASRGEAVVEDVQQIGTAIRDAALSVTATEAGLEGRVYLRTKPGVSSRDVADLTKGVVAALKAEPSIDSHTLHMLDQVRVRSQDDQVRMEFMVHNAMLTAAQ